MNKDLIKNIKKYIKDNYKEEKRTGIFAKRKFKEKSFSSSEMLFEKCQVSIDVDFKIKDTWQQSVFHFIDLKGYKDPDVYKRANLSKQTFSKIRSDMYYQPNKDTALQMCIGLMLNIDETKDLLAKAGFALSNGIKRDLVVRYFIENEIYNVDELNLILDELSLKLFPIN
jgi:hypothetical protein